MMRDWYVDFESLCLKLGGWAGVESKGPIVIAFVKTRAIVGAFPDR